MEFIKFLVFGCTIFLTVSHCRAQRKLQLKPVVLITRVLSRRDPIVPSATDDEDEEAVEKIDELCEEERERACKDGLEMIGGDFRYSEAGRTTELREYVVEVERPEEVVSIEFVKAFECPTVPPAFIQVHTFGSHLDYQTALSVIFKTIGDDFPTLEDIVGYQIEFAQYLSEAESGELQACDPRDFTKGRSLIDADELTEKQCLQACKKAVLMLSPENVSFDEDALKRCTKNRYYFTDNGESTDDDNDDDHNNDDDNDDDESGDIVVVQAFKCSTQPEIYVHVDKNGVMWFIVERKDLRLPYDIVGYELKPVAEISAVAKKTAMQTSQDVVHTTMVDFDRLSAGDRLTFCRNTIRIIFGTRVRLLEDTEIADSEFYGLRLTPGRDVKCTIVQAIVCPTDSSVVGRAYVHVSNRGDIHENNVQVFVLRNVDNARLSAWNDDE